MKVSLNWLKQYVDFDGPPGELAQQLTMLGLEVEEPGQGTQEPMLRQVV